MAKKKSAKSQQADETKEAESLDFEAALQHVEEIVDRLESGELNLTESLEQYEVGVKRLKQCHQLLQAAEQRVSVLAGFDADGNPVTEPLSESMPGEPLPDAGHSDETPTEKPRPARRHVAKGDATNSEDPGLF